MTSSVKHTEAWLAAFAAAHWVGRQLRATVGLAEVDYDVPAQGTVVAPAENIKLDSLDLSEGRIQLFEAFLAEAIFAQLRTSAADDVRLSVICDHQRILRSATRAAEIPSAMVLMPPEALVIVGIGCTQVRPRNGAKFERDPTG